MVKSRFGRFSDDEKNVIEEALIRLDISEDDFYDNEPGLTDRRAFKRKQKQLLKEVGNSYKQGGK